MNRSLMYVIGAVILIGIGVVLLLQNLDILQGGGTLIWALAFAAGGLAMLGVFAGSPKANWWAIIPGLVLLALGILIGTGERLGAWGGAMFLGAIGLSFWIVYFTNRQFWWAIIPGGVLLTLMLVVGLAEMLKDLEVGGIFFLGLGVTFALIYLLPTPEGRMKWAIWPAGILLLMGVIITLASASILNWLWAAGLIAGGLYLVFRAIFPPKGQPKAHVPQEPREPTPPPAQAA